MSSNSFGFPAAFLERQKFIATLYSTLQHKDRVHTGQPVVSIRHEKSHAIVRTAGGQEYKAHLVVGADGVHSTVRSGMWKYAAPNSQLGNSAADNFTTCSALKLEYACIYGISKQVPNIEAGIWYNLLDKQITIHLIGTKAGKVFWFLIVKQDGNLRARLTTEDARRICESLQSRRISPTLTFGDLWKECYIFKMTPLEEGWFSMWHAGRLVITGDAIRKVSEYHLCCVTIAIEPPPQHSPLLPPHPFFGAPLHFQPRVSETPVIVTQIFVRSLTCENNRWRLVLDKAPTWPWKMPQSLPTLYGEWAWMRQSWRQKKWTGGLQTRCDTTIRPRGSVGPKRCAPGLSFSSECRRTTAC